MSEAHHSTARVLVGAVTQTKSRSVEELAKTVADLIGQAGVSLVRSVVVKCERQYIRQLISNVANDNEADAIVLVGGTGIGPRDDTCEAIDGFVERRIEGFAGAYRRLLEVELGAHSLLSRATAGVYNQCVVFAMTGRVTDVARATQTLILPTLTEAISLATGRHKAGDGK